MKPLSALAAPFAQNEIEWRAQSTGKTNDGKPWIRVLAFIDNRAIMERLDDVCGPENWRNEYATGPHGGVLCGISILVTRPSCADEYASRDEWVTKWDGAENTDIEGVKGGLSGAMKRAGYQWGIGRYLYNLEEGFGIVSPNGANYVKGNNEKHGGAFKWNAPSLPAWALPGGSGKPGVAPRVEHAKAVLQQAEASVGLKVESKGAASVRANLLTAGDMRLPGAPKRLRGHGGKRIGDLSNDVLESLMVDFRALAPEARAKFTDTIEAIGEVLADRADGVV